MFALESILLAGVIIERNLDTSTGNFKDRLFHILFDMKQKLSAERFFRSQVVQKRIRCTGIGVYLSSCLMKADVPIIMLRTWNITLDCLLSLVSRVRETAAGDGADAELEYEAAGEEEVAVLLTATELGVTTGEELER